MNLPKDPYILLSYINTKLRDDYSTLEDLCKSQAINQDELITSLLSIHYEYHAETNKFISID